MKITYTQHTLDKIELLLKGLQYKLRYEKGNFKTASCLLLHDKVVVINRFSNLESKINALINLLQSIHLESNKDLDEKQLQFFHSLKQTRIQF